MVYGNGLWLGHNNKGELYMDLETAKTRLSNHIIVETNHKGDCHTFTVSIQKVFKAIYSATFRGAYGYYRVGITEKQALNHLQRNFK